MPCRAGLAASAVPAAPAVACRRGRARARSRNRGTTRDRNRSSPHRPLAPFGLQRFQRDV